MNAFPTFDSHSSLALPIVHLSIEVGIVMAAIFLLVTVLVLYASVRFRKKEGQGEPRQKFGNSRKEIVWVIGPLLILGYLFAASMLAMSRSDPTPSPGRQPDLIIIGHQWWWEARYMHTGAIAANEIHIPLGKPLYVRLESADVIHDWWVPQLGRKMDAIPAHPNFFWLEADSPGAYQGTCAEYCGVEHAWMRILVVAESESDFDRWSAHQLEAPSATPTSADEQQGAILFQQLTCPACHSIDASSNVNVGPSLAHIAGRQTLAAGRMANTRDNLTAWLMDPQNAKPGCNMPNFQLNEQQAKQLAAYLGTLQ